MAQKAKDEIKKLNSLKTNLEAEIETLEISQNHLKQEIGLKKSNLNSLKQKIKSLEAKNKELAISEHAIIRYMERVMGINIEDICALILPDDSIDFIKSMGDGQYPINNGNFKIIVKNGTVITVEK